MKDDTKKKWYDDEKSVISQVNEIDTLIINSGCLHHMTSDVENFESLEEYDGGCVRLGNDAPCFVKGKGPILLEKKLSVIMLIG